MARAITIELVGYNRILARIRLIQNSIFSRMLMSEIGLYVMTRVKKRTIEGKDVNGTPFKPYSAQYKMFRQKHGHPSDKVNLVFTGSMLSSMTFDPDADKVSVYFLNTSDEHGGRNPEKAYFLNEERNFFALSEDDVEGIVDIVENYYRRLIG